MDDTFNSLIAVLFGSGVFNLFLLFWVVNLQLKNHNLKYELWQRENWHQKQMQKWRERL